LRHLRHFELKSADRGLPFASCLRHGSVMEPGADGATEASINEFPPPGE
jgi:hypothetical protein